MKASDTATFGQSYAECRSLFLDAAAAAGLPVTSRVRHELTGPAGEELACDIAIAGPRSAAAILFVTCGTHGVEGPAGSGVQVAWMTKRAAAFASTPCAVAMIHAVNPYGFAHLRRVDENNIDPNRNCYDYSGPVPQNEGYRALHDVLCPELWAPDQEQQIRAALGRFEQEHGTNAMRDALSAGQFEIPHGLFYGGRRETWTTRTLREIFTTYGGQAERFAYLDLHSGLGASGEPVMLSFDPPESLARARARRWFGASAIDDSQDALMAANYVGLLRNCARDALPDREMTHAVVEFGTVAPERIVAAIVREHYLHRSSTKWAAENAAELENIRSAFAPTDALWRARVAAHGIRIIDEAIRGLVGQ